jgi:arsenate reductase (thioredoxin)
LEMNLPSRTRCILTTAVLFTGLALAQTAPAVVPSPQVVFVCEHGAAKSVIAATYFNQLAQQRGLPERAVTRGTNIDPAFSPTVVSGLRKEAMPLPVGKPLMVTATEAAQSERVVTLGCRLPDAVKEPAKTTSWDDISSPSANFEQAKDTIVRHVQELADELSRARQHPHQ